jgi:hypothetical protein
MHRPNGVPNDHLDAAIALMRGFAERTGLEPERGPPIRYLWTDAFAVCNYIGIARRSADRAWLELAERLARQVHDTLGRHRPDDPRQGPIAGFSEEQFAEHPTAGGLRIGKPLRERAADEAFDERLEWERDGQYFHYLTKWMHALDRLGRATGDVSHHRHARELARAAHAAFTRLAHPGRMVWKASVALDRALVRSMGQHDALDAFVTYRALAASPSGGGPELDDELHGAGAMVDVSGLATSDPLGIGGLLFDANRLARLSGRAAERVPSFAGSTTKLIDRLLASAAIGVEDWLRAGELRRPAAQRLAFRELGLVIGLEAVAPIAEQLRGAGADESLESLLGLGGFAADLCAFWRRQLPGGPESLRDIDEVMLATALVPGGFLELG